MVIRKPYAFLIKNFKKIHIFLFLLCAFIYYKVLQVNEFVSEFMQLGSYDSYNEPIARYINFFIYLISIWNFKNFTNFFIFYIVIKHLIW